MGNYRVQVSIILIGSMIFSAGTWATTPFIIFYLLKYITQNEALVGFIIGAGPFVSVTASIVGGAYINRLNLRYFMLATLTLSAIGFALYAPALKSHNLANILVVETLLWAVMALFSIAIKVYISNYIADQWKAKAFTLRYAGFNVGATVGPAIGAYFSHNGDNLDIFYYSSFMILITAIVFYFGLSYIENKKPAINTNQNLSFINMLKLAWNHETILLLTTMFFILQFASAYVYTILPLTLHNTIENPTIIYASLVSLNSVVIVIASFFIVFIIHKFSLKNLTISGIICFGAGFLILALGKSIVWLYIAIIVAGIGEVGFSTCINLYIDKSAKNYPSGMIFGVSNLALLGMSAGALIGSGALQLTHNALLTFMIPVLLIFVSYFIFIKIHNTLDRV